MQTLIVNADDFGMNKSATEAICECFEKGLITDTTMMANGEYFEEALALMKTYHLENKIGIHFNLSQGRPLTEPITHCPYFVKDGVFTGYINKYKYLTRKERKAIYTELFAQVKRLTDNGVHITHADAHHHVHVRFFFVSTFVKVCNDCGIEKMRLHRNFGTFSLPKRLVKAAVNAYMRLHHLRTASYFSEPADALCGSWDGCLEMMVHPDYDENGALMNRLDYNEKGQPYGEEMPVVSGVRMIGYDTL